MENKENQNPNPQSNLSTNQKPLQSRILQKPEKKWGDNIFLKGCLVILLILAMLLPTPFILNLINERKERKEEVVRKEGERFGRDQVLYGPFVKISYVEDDSEREYIYISPNQLKINGELNSESKHRGLFNVALYQTDLQIKANFHFSQLPQHEKRKYDLANADIVFSINDYKGLQKDIVFNVDGNNRVSEPGSSMRVEAFSDTDQYYQPKYVEEYKTTINLKDKENLSVTIPLSIMGTGELNFLPISPKTTISLNTSADNLKFDGVASPSDSFKDGVRVLEWNVSSRRMAQIWENTSNLEKNKFGLEIIQPNDEYGKTNRVAKYSILFIGLTFVTFLFVEIINKLRIHPLQYVLVGFALIIFYLLLLSISEHIGFNKSYIISATATILLICWFVLGIVKKVKIVGVVFVVLLFLYSYIFIIIQLDEMALLAGSIGLFIILTLMMYFSRKIEWKRD